MMKNDQFVDLKRDAAGDQVVEENILKFFGFISIKSF